jgi:hypothetical protein
MYPWCAAVALVFAIPLFASAGLVITEVQPQTSAGTASTINGDWWELTNTGPGAVNLLGYSWADEEDRTHPPLSMAGPNPNGFPNVSIAAGESIIIIDESMANEGAWRTNWGAPASLNIISVDEMIDLAPPDAGGAFSGLSSDGDSVFFYGPMGDLLSSYTYTSPITRGTTFEVSMGGGNLGLSVVGENGAVMASNGDKGSPGVAVPEPASIFMIMSAAAMALAVRRTRSFGDSRLPG